MIAHAAAYLVRHGPVTQQERWEEASGYSPSTLASNIAALICAACLFRERRDEATAIFLEEYADFLDSHVESWTVTTRVRLCPGISRHYIRILPESVRQSPAGGRSQQRTPQIANVLRMLQSEVPSQGHRRCRVSRTGALWNPKTRRFH